MLKDIFNFLQLTDQLLSQPPKITYSILPIRVWPSVRSLCSAVVVV